MSSLLYIRAKTGALNNEIVIKYETDQGEGQLKLHMNLCSPTQEARMVVFAPMDFHMEHTYVLALLCEMIHNPNIFPSKF